MGGHIFPKLPVWWSEKGFGGGIERSCLQNSSYWPAVLLVVLAGVLFYSRLLCPLLEPEEARYAEIPREMLAQGRWLVPVLHGEAYYQKPPLLYWLVMLSYQVFGVHDWAARLVPTTAGVAIVVIVYAWARRTVERGQRWPAASFSVCRRVSCIWPAWWAWTVCCAPASSALAFGHIAQAPAGGWPRLSLGRWWWLASASCCGLGVMTKGPVAIVLVLGPLLAWHWLDRRGRSVTFRWWLAYLSVVLAVAAPWYVAIAAHDPQATGTFFWLHNVVRYWAPFDHEKPGWFYLPGLVIGMLPWSLLLIPLVPYLWRPGRRWTRRRPRAGLFSARVRVVPAVFLAVGMQARPTFCLRCLAWPWCLALS